MEQQHYFYPKAWDSICRLKNERSPSFKFFHNISKAFLVKLTWKLTMAIEEFWVKCFRRKYVKNLNFLNMEDVLGSWAYVGV